MMMKPETLTLILVNLAGIMEKADESLLPGVYKEVGRALNTDPTGLGSLTLFRSIVQACCYPLAAYLASTHNRAHVIALGAFLWSAATFLVAFSSTFTQVAISRGLNGIGLAIVTPAIQSLVADSTDETNRGTAFGWLHFTANMGSILGGLCSVLIASTSFMGIPGWRLAFHLVGLVSIIVGILVGIFAKDPHFLQNNNTPKTPQRSFWLEFKDLLKESKSVIKIPSFQIIVAQGVAGSFPWSALSFAPMWLELIGFSHKTVALLGGLFGISVAVGGLFGGMIGDKLSQRLPNSGRILLAQISSGSGIPLAAILLLILPDDPSTAFNHGLIMVIMGLLISWCGPATNNPIFAEIVPEKSRTNIYALDRSFESILSSFAPPIVGILTQHVFGYVPVKKGLTGSEEIETDRENAASLAKALYTAIGIPFTICCIVYSFLYWTYPRDIERARMVALIDSEMERIESFGWGGDEREEEERSVIDMSYDVEDSIELDENDEKRLLAKGVKSSDLGR